MPPRKLSSPDDFEQLLQDHDFFCFDCDGVIWHGMELISGVLPVMNMLRARGKQICFVTNSASKCREDLRQKFITLGIDVKLDEVFSSGFAAVAYLKYVLNFPIHEKNVFVIGGEGIERELELEGFTYKGGTHPAHNVLGREDWFPNIGTDPSIAAIVAGFDGNMNYMKLARAHSYIRENGAHFIMTNDDHLYAGPDGRVYPGAGAQNASLVCAVRDIVKPTVVGKPHSQLLESIEKVHKLDRKRTIMFGDRLDTDILFGKNGGISTCLVLTGVHQEKHLEASEDPPCLPDYCINSLGDLSIIA